MQLTLRVLGIHKGRSRTPISRSKSSTPANWNTAADGWHRQPDCRALGGERPDFVIGLTDVLASGVISALTDKGISVPEQVRVAGCDGNPLAWAGRSPDHGSASRLRDWPARAFSC